jgi:hypothetical protein
MKYRHAACGQTFRRPNSQGWRRCPKCQGWMCNCDACVGSGYEVVFEWKKFIHRKLKVVARAIRRYFDV